MKFAFSQGTQIVKPRSLKFKLMNLYRGGGRRHDNDNAKSIAAIPIAGIIFATTFLSGLLPFTGSSCYNYEDNYLY